MSKQLDAAPSRRALARMRALAVAAPAAATAAALSSPAAAPGSPAVTPTRVAAGDYVAALDAPNDLPSFESTLAIVEPFRTLPAHAKRAHASRLESALRALVLAGNRIARAPYVYGGGHGSFNAAGYDCSGSVSYVLHAAGLLDTPQDSSGLESYGDPGRGRHITIYANAGHALLTIDGRRFDTIAFQETGTRWSSTTGDTSGYVVRHPRGM
jgi:cell wall-associated NlpC family hydrolase